MTWQSCVAQPKLIASLFIDSYATSRPPALPRTWASTCSGGESQDLSEAVDQGWSTSRRIDGAGVRPLGPPGEVKASELRSSGSGLGSDWIIRRAQKGHPIEDGARMKSILHN